MISPQNAPIRYRYFSRLRQNVNAHLHLSAFIAIIVIFLANFETSAWGDERENQVISLQQITLSSGSILTYEAHTAVQPLRPPVRDDYSVRIQDIWPGGAIFQYAMSNRVLDKGIQALSSLDRCTKIDPWWDPSQTDYDDRCELWIPAQNLNELKTEGKTYLAVDTEARNDSIVRWELAGKLQFLCDVDGQKQKLDSLRVRTSRDDEFIILDDPQNPLILSAKSTYFRWNIVSISRG